MDINKLYLITVVFFSLVTTRFTVSEYSVAQENDDLYYKKSHVDTLEARIAELESKLKNLSVENGEMNGMPGPHLIITGANLHIRNGKGGTNTEVNGLGNLIIGYNEKRSSSEVNKNRVPKTVLLAGGITSVHPAAW